jgi:hypothetical protein
MMLMGAGRKCRAMEKVEKRYCTAAAGKDFSTQMNN